MEPMSEEDSRAIMNVVQQGLVTILEQAMTRLPFPIKVTATCPAGFVMAMSIAHAGAEPVVMPIVEQVAMVTYPITVTCIGKNGKKVVATMEQPERHSEGSA
jgi:hypothetical protein